MPRVHWLDSALADLDTILSHIAEHNAQAAYSLYEDIDRMTAALPDRPYLYRRGRVSGTRELVIHPNYYVVYRLVNAEIQILRVMHSRQQYPKRVKHST